METRCAVLIFPLLSLVTFAQITIQGKNQVSGGIQVNSPFTRNVQIMAVFPPAFGTPDYTTFRSNVMNQSSVDGVTLNIVWSQVESSSGSNPSATACPSVGSDTCQLDFAGQYHSYDWSAYDHAADAMHPLGISSWFNSFGGLKKVNLILSGIDRAGAGIDSASPWYVTSSNYVANFPPTYNRQDVVNAANACSNIPWIGTVASSSITFKRAAGSSTVMVHSPGCCSMSATTPIPAGTIRDGDLVWVYNADAGLPGYNTGTGGAVAAVPTDNDDFTYSSSSGSGPDQCSSGQCTYIGIAQSSPVPYERPYLAAWEAFMAAANAHFNPNYQANGITVGSGGTTGTNQLGYVRSGTWSGGESFVYCLSNLKALNAPYNFIDSSIIANTWLNDYQAKVNYIQSISPTMNRYWPIDTIVSGDTTYPDTMAQYATNVGNAQGYVNGFGSQGLSLFDKQNGCGNAVADWCNLFTGASPLPPYYRYGMPLELQQLSISNPDVSTCNATQCGPPPTKVSGDLRLWLPFAVNNDATVIEMYYQDLGLAFDSTYCSPTVSNCSLGGYTCYVPANNNISATTECGWFNEVGQNGDKSYATTINAEHGPH